MQICRWVSISLIFFTVRNWITDWSRNICKTLNNTTNIILIAKHLILEFIQQLILKLDGVNILLKFRILESFFSNLKNWFLLDWSITPQPLIQLTSVILLKSLEVFSSKITSKFTSFNYLRKTLWINTS